LGREVWLGGNGNQCDDSMIRKSEASIDKQLIQFYQEKGRENLASYATATTFASEPGKNRRRS
jgi:hypothetical protein